MIISSELTGKRYKTVEECLEAEREFLRKEEEKKKAKEAQQAAIDKAYDEAVAACDKYFELVGIDLETIPVSKVFDMFFE